MNKKLTEKILNGVMEQERFVTLEVKFLEDNSLMTDLNLITLRNHIKEHIKETISLAFAEKDVELKELKQLYKVRNDDAKDYAKTITKKDAQKDLFIKKLKEKAFETLNQTGKNVVWIRDIDKLNKEIFEDE